MVSSLGVCMVHSVVYEMQLMIQSDINAWIIGPSTIASMHFN